MTVTAVPLHQAELYPDVPGIPTLRPGVVIVPTQNINEYVIAYAPYGGDTYVRFVSTVGDTIQLGPALALGSVTGGGGPVSDFNMYAVQVYNTVTTDPLAFLRLNASLGYIIHDAGSLTTTPTVVQTNTSPELWMLAVSAGGTFGWTWDTTNLYRFPITGSTLGGSSSTPLGFTPPGTSPLPTRPYRGGLFTSEYLAPWRDLASAHETYFQRVGINTSTDTLDFGPVPSSGVGLGGQVPRSVVRDLIDLDNWMISAAPFSRVVFVDNDGTPLAVSDDPIPGTDLVEWAQPGGANSFVAVNGPSLSVVTYDGSYVPSWVSGYCTINYDALNVNNVTHEIVDYTKTLVGHGRYLSLIGEGDDTPCQPLSELGAGASDWSVGSVG